jgi:tetratricopeptide (TPR) repeat protein
VGLEARGAHIAALDVDPHYPGAHHWYAQLLAVLSRHEEALREIGEARRCDPVSVPVNAFVSDVWLEARDYRRAIDAALDALELDSGVPLPYFFLGRAYAKLHEHRKAIAALTNAARLGNHVALFESSLAYACAGQRAKAEQIVGHLNIAPHGGTSAIDLALVWVGLGETNAALDALEQAFAARSPRMINVNDPFFAELAHEPRYKRLLVQLGLPGRPS